MTEIRRLRPPIELDTPRGRAWAYLVIDYGMHHNLHWVTFLRESGECWTYQNPDVHLAPCETTRTRLQEVIGRVPGRRDACPALSDENQATYDLLLSCYTRLWRAAHRVCETPSYLSTEIREAVSRLRGEMTQQDFQPPAEKP